MFPATNSKIIFLVNLCLDNIPTQILSSRQYYLQEKFKSTVLKPYNLFYFKITVTNVAIKDNCWVKKLYATRRYGEGVVSYGPLRFALVSLRKPLNSSHAYGIFFHISNREMYIVFVHQVDLKT